MYYKRYFVLVAVLFALSACRKPASVNAGREDSKTFASPDEAGRALFQAAKAGNPDSLLQIIGPDGKDILFSGDAEIDKTALKDFATAYETMNRWGKIESGGEMLYVGADNFPFPIPLEKNSAGQWSFNIDKGADEVLARQIGKNELVAMAALGAIANAQQQYFSQLQPGETVYQYAQKFVSDDGKHNGLYWSASQGQEQSPLAQMGDFVEGAGFATPGEKPRPFSGYNFRILTTGKTGDAENTDYRVDGKMTGGFAVLAYPAEYGDSGIMSFMIGSDGVIYEKDLGNQTADAVQSMTGSNPSDGWKAVNKTE